MSQTTADFSPDVRNYQEESPYIHQEWAKNFESFQEYMREGAEADNDFTPEDFKTLLHLEKVLNKEAILEHSYRADFEKAKADLERIMGSKLPIQMKIKMADSIRENLKSKLDCLRELNKITKEMIMRVEKTNNYSTYINMIQRWKEASKFGKASSVASTNMSSYMANSGYNNNKNSLVDNPRKHTQSFLSNQSVTDEMTEEQRAVEEMRSENIKLEDMIANLKESRNLLIMGLENMKDDMDEYQEFVQGKKIVLQNTLSRIESMKSIISTQSLRKSTNVTSGNSAKVWKHDDHGRGDMSRVNTTVLQDVSTKVTGFFGKMFKKKEKPINTDKVLPTELFTDINVHIPTQGSYTPTYVNLTPKSIPKSQPVSSTIRGKKC